MFLLFSKKYVIFAANLGVLVNSLWKVLKSQLNNTLRKAVHLRRAKDGELYPYSAAHSGGMGISFYGKAFTCALFLTL